MDNLMTQPLKQPTWRKPAGMLAILLIILVWAVLIVSTLFFICMSGRMIPGMAIIAS